MRTETADYIATESILWLHSDGTEVRIEAKVGLPYLVDEGMETWACPACLEGVDGRYPDIMGQGSLQALSLAIRLVAKRLGDLLEDNAQLYYPGYGDDRIPWDWSSHGALFGTIKLS